MRGLLLAGALMGLSASPAAAQWLQPMQPMAPTWSAPALQPPPPPPRSSYDWRSGDMYTVAPQYGGGAQVYGNNVRTGTAWSQTVQPNGNQSGFDSRGNSWTYNRQTGAYLNSNGHGCVGQGYARTCW